MGSRAQGGGVEIIGISKFVGWGKNEEMNSPENYFPPPLVEKQEKCVGGEN